MSIVACYDAGTSLQSLSASPDQRLCCVGGRDVLQIVRVDHQDRGDATHLSSLPAGAAGGSSRAASPTGQLYATRVHPRSSSLQAGATARSQRVFSRSLAAAPMLPPPPSTVANAAHGFVAPPSPDLSPFEPRPDLSGSPPRQGARRRGVLGNKPELGSLVPAAAPVVATWKVSFCRERSLKTGNMNLNHNGNDVAWHPSPACANLIATGSTKGAVVCWNIERTGRAAAQMLSSEHNRTVTRVCWHPTDPHMLASASIDGTMRIWDTRTSGGSGGGTKGKKAKWKSTLVIKPRASGARFVMFNPHDGNTIAGAFDNGTVQVWDTRKARSARCRFAAHHGYVLTLDWHPKHRGVLATGGRDGQIKVWDTEKSGGLNRGKAGFFGHRDDGGVGNGGVNATSGSRKKGKSTSEVRQLTMIQSITSVACVRWRSAAHEFQLASSSTVVDPTLNVWDVQNPYIPIAVLKGHKSAVTQFQWFTREHESAAGNDSYDVSQQQQQRQRQTSNNTSHLLETAIISCSTDNSLCFHSLAHAERPVKEVATCAIAVSPRGGFAAYTDPIPQSRRHDRELNPLGPAEIPHMVEGRRPSLSEREAPRRAGLVGARKGGSSSSNAASTNPGDRPQLLRVRSMPALMFVRARLSAIHLCTPHHNHTFGIDFDSFSSYAERYRCVVGGSQRLPAAGKSMTAAQVCEYNGNVAKELGCRLRTQAWETLSLLMRSLEMSIDHRKQVQWEKEQERLHVLDTKDSREDNALALDERRRLVSRINSADREDTNAVMMRRVGGAAESGGSAVDARGGGNVSGDDSDLMALHRGGGGMRNDEMDDDLYLADDMDGFDTIEGGLSEGMLRGMGGGILDQLDLANPNGAAFLDYDDDDEDVGFGFDGGNGGRIGNRRNAKSSALGDSQKRQFSQRHQHQQQDQEQQQQQQQFGSSLSAVTLDELELFASASLQGRRIKEARVNKKRQERELIRQAAREERKEARKKEKAEQKELRRRKKVRAAEMAAKAAAALAASGDSALPGSGGATKAETSADASVLGTDAVTTTPAGPGSVGGNDNGGNSAGAADNSADGSTIETVDDKALRIAAEAAVELAAEAEFERVADERERAYEEEETRKESAADADEDIAYENDLSLSPLFKELHLEVVRELLEHYCEQGDVQMCSTISMVLGKLVTGLFGEARVQQWHSAYVEQLMQLRLPVVAATVMVRAGGLISRKNQRSTTIYTACRQCGNSSISPSEAPSRCNKCKRYARCVVCEEPVIGPFVWRSACGHGGHLRCMEMWREAMGQEGVNHVVCPAGCPEPEAEEL